MAKKPSQQKPKSVLNDRLGHFCPLLLTILLLMIELVFGVIANRIEAAGGFYPNGIKESGDTSATVLLFEIQDYPAEIIFALLAFWVWALTTLGTGQRLIQGGGRYSGTAAARRQEFPPVLIYALATIVLFGVTFVRLVPTPYTWFPAVIASGFPFFVLGKP